MWVCRSSSGVDEELLCSFLNLDSSSIDSNERKIRHSTWSEYVSSHRHTVSIQWNHVGDSFRCSDSALTGVGTWRDFSESKWDSVILFRSLRSTQGTPRIGLYEWCTHDYRTTHRTNAEVGEPLLKDVSIVENFLVRSVLGHEAVVEVIAHRRPESNLAVGDRLTFSVADSCGQCEFCLKGLNQKCVQLFKVGRQRVHCWQIIVPYLQYGHAKLSDGSGYNGCYATHVILRRGTHVTKIPDNISDRCAAPINCSLATAMCAMESIPKIKNGRAFVQVSTTYSREIVEESRRAVSSRLLSPEVD